MTTRNEKRKKVDASLKGKVKRHFEKLGFVRCQDGLLSPPPLTKDIYRGMHSFQRAARIKDNRTWIQAHAEKLIGMFASGAELDVKRIEPRIKLVESGTVEANLFRLATYYWRIPVSEGYGRRMRFLVWDEYHGRVIGLFALGDAVFNLRARDEFIGWDYRRRAEAMVNIMDAYALGAVPPYNMLPGGKLVATLVRTRNVVETFRAKYKDSIGVISGKNKDARLVAVTTTSALGKSSMYNRLRLDGEDVFRSIGNTSGWGNFHISDKLVGELRDYLRREKDPYADAHEYGEGPNFRLRIIKRALGRLGLDPNLARHGLTREVFFCALATNAKEFLRGEQKIAKYGSLMRVDEAASAAMERWVIPRAERMPDFRNWRRDMFLGEISS